jgi:bacterioferritin
MCEDWGYERLAAKSRHESIDEMHDAERLVERILFLGGVPNLQRLGAVQVGEDVEEQLRLDLAVERDAIERYNRVISLCAEHGDNGTRELLERHLVGEENHASWLTSQLSLIADIGIERYLAQQIHGT